MLTRGVSMRARLEVRGRPFRRETLYLATVVAFAGFLRLMAVGLRGEYLGFDESMFIVLGRNLLEGRGYTLNGLSNATFPFGLPLVAGAFYRLTGGARWALNLPTAIFGALGVIPVYIIARDLWDRLTGLSAAILYAGLPALLFLVPFVPYGERLYAGTETVFSFFILSAAAVFVRLMRRPTISAGLALGFFSGLSFQVRQDALGYFAVFLVCAWVWASLRAGRLFHRRAVSAAAAACLVFAVLAAPFLFWVRHVTGRWSLGPRFATTFRMRGALEAVVQEDRWGEALEAYFSTNEENSQLESPYYGVGDYHRRRFAAGDYDLSAGAVLGGLEPANLARAWRLVWRRLLPPGAWVPVLVGVVSAVFERRRRALVFLGAAALPNAFVAMALYVLARFYLVFALGLLFFGARGVDLCARGAVRLLPRGWRRVRAAAFVYSVLPLSIALVFATATIQRARVLSNRYDNFERHLESQVGQFMPVLREVVPPGARVVAFSPVIAARADVTWLALPAESPADIVEYARNRRADFIVLREIDGYWRGYGVDDFVRILGGESALVDDIFAEARWAVFDMSAGKPGR